jgi:LPPG:FO 2-phospho-L-lactate transferase
MIDTAEGVLPFQDYFVRLRCAPAVTGVRFDGAAEAAVLPAALAAMAEADAIVICPSNPYLSVDPILAVPGFRAALASAPAPVVAISPLVGGKAVKGPTGKIMAELGVPATAAAVARHYAGLIDGLVIDHADGAAVPDLPIAARVTATLMETLDDRERLAADSLAFAAELAASGVRAR